MPIDMVSHVDAAVAFFMNIIVFACNRSDDYKRNLFAVKIFNLFTEHDDAWN